MEETNERRVISRKQMSTKLLDAFILWALVFGFAATIAKTLILMPVSLIFSGVFYNILATIIDLILCAVQWIFIARIAVKLTFKRYTINKSENVGILNKTMVVFSAMYILVCIANLFLKGGALGMSLGIGMFGSVAFLILLDIITTIAAIAILKYVLNSQDGYIYRQCVEGQLEEKVGLSVEEIVLLVIIGLIALSIVSLIISSMNSSILDNIPLDNGKQEVTQSTITEDGKQKAKIIAQNVHAKNLYKEVNGTYEKATAAELQKLINEELKEELGEQYFVIVTEDLEIKYSFEENLETNETNQISQKDSLKIAEAKSVVARAYADNLYKEEMVNGELLKSTPEELEQAINNKLLEYMGPEYTVTVSEDHKITYNFEIE